MAEPFKELINADAVEHLVQLLQAARPGFDGAQTLRRAIPKLPDLELKDRTRLIADHLREALPHDWVEAVDLLVQALPPPLPTDERVGEAFHLWPVLTVVEHYGLDHPAHSLQALRQMTQRFSAEFAVRPYLLKHPELTWSKLETWTTDPSLHVRRWCSEGTRPRLPWGQVLRPSVADPSRGLALLERLKDDPQRYVQRSVANHLNDVAKDHPRQVVDIAERWWADGGDGRRWAVRHGLRTLLKKGDKGALSVIGFGPVRVDAVTLRAEPDTVAWGGETRITATVTSDATQDQRCLAEWVVHYRKSNGGDAPKVFRGPEKVLKAGETWTLSKKLSFKPITTRKYYAGAHRVELQINGEVVGGVGFELGVRG